MWRQKLANSRIFLCGFRRIGHSFAQIRLNLVGFGLLLSVNAAKVILWAIENALKSVRSGAF